MKLLLIYHETGVSSGRVEKLVKNTQGRKIKIEVATDTKVLSTIVTSGYDAVLLDSISIPQESLANLVAAFSKTLVLILTEGVDDDEEVHFYQQALPSVCLARPTAEDILEVICLEQAIPLAEDSISIVAARLESIEQELKRYVTKNTTYKSKE